MRLLESRVHGEEKTTDTSFRNDEMYLLPTIKEIDELPPYSNRTKFALQRLGTYGCEAKME